MSEFSPIYKVAIGAVWTAGYRPTDSEKNDLKRACGYGVDFNELWQTGGRDSAIKALEAAGYTIADEPDVPSLHLVRPLPFIRESVPMAGHVIRLGGPWSIMKAGDIAGLQGEMGVRLPGYAIANARAGWHCGTRPDRANYISMGNGGPASIAKLDVSRLQATDETYRLRAWAWMETPRANGGADFYLTVPVWTWTPAGGDSDFLKF